LQRAAGYARVRCPCPFGREARICFGERIPYDALPPQRRLPPHPRRPLPLAALQIADDGQIPPRPAREAAGPLAAAGHGRPLRLVSRRQRRRDPPAAAARRRLPPAPPGLG